MAEHLHALQQVALLARIDGGNQAVADFEFEGVYEQEVGRGGLFRLILLRFVGRLGFGGAVGGVFVGDHPLAAEE